jgi:hypothetical protein
MGSMALPTDIARITQFTRADQLVVRNLYITQRYHDLSLALAEVLGGPDVNWSTFATWASKTAGQSVRNEEVPSFVDDLVGEFEDDVMHPLGKIESAIHAVVPTTGFHVSFLLAPIKETIETVSGSISAGNLKVFAELAPLFVQFVEQMRAAPPPAPGGLAALLEGLDPRPIEEGGQDMLRRAFTHYFKAAVETDPVEKARLVLAGNCQIGLHEQTRLQPQIEQAMDAPIDDILRKHLHASLGTGAGKGILSRLIDTIERPLRDLTDVVGDLWERIATRFLMTLALPGGAQLPLGRNIPKEAAAQSFLPPPLQNITAPDELLALMRQFDRARGATEVGSASVDWRLLPDRMNFIVNLFRSRQQSADLFGQPFSDAQRALIEKDEVPPAGLGKL